MPAFFRNTPRAIARVLVAVAFAATGACAATRNRSPAQAAPPAAFRGTIALDVECIEAQLADVGGAWETAHKPRHPDAGE